jgi:transcriptional regulator with XRE-family HTH domain
MTDQSYRRTLRTHRKRLQLTQAAAAERAGLTGATWAYVERGHRYVQGKGMQPYNPSPETLAKMATAVGLDPRFLLMQAGMDPGQAGLETAVVQSGTTKVALVVLAGELDAEALAARVQELLADGL